VAGQVLSKLGPDAKSERVAPSTYRLAAEWPAITALRVEEVADLTIFDIFDLERQINPHDPNRLLKFSLVGKGDKPRVVPVPTRLVQWTLRYIKTTRAAIVDKLLNIHSAASRQMPTALFLNSLDANHRQVGRPTSKDAISRAFSAAVIAAGFVRIEQCVVHDDFGNPKMTSEGYLWESKCVAMYTYHALRHTAAINYYTILKRMGYKNPWKELQLILGHEFISTTINIYGRFAPLEDQGLEDAYNEHLRSFDFG
jgi:integrase